MREGEKEREILEGESERRREREILEGESEGERERERKRDFRGRE